MNPQTITFTTPAPSGMVGAIGVSVHANASSSLAVTYSSTTLSVCTVIPATGVLTLLSAGTCTIAANQAGNGTYAAAPQVTQDVAVSLNPQTITFTTPAPSGMVGAIGVSVHANASSGLTVTYSSTTLSVCTVIPATGVLTLLGAGTCTIAANQAGNGTYCGRPPQVTQDVAVSLNPQTIAFVAAPTGVTVGASGVSVSATATSGLPVAYSSTTPSICTVDASTGALTLLGIGTCTIAADQAGDGTYEAAVQVTPGRGRRCHTRAVASASSRRLSKPNFAAAGNVLHFNFTLTNTGNMVLDGPFQCYRDKIAVVTCPVTATLALGASIVCTGTYTVTRPTWTPATVVMTATGHGPGRQRGSGRHRDQGGDRQRQPAATPPSVGCRDGRSDPGRHAAAHQHRWRLLGQRSTPLFALLICLAFAGLGLLAVQAQRRTVRP